MKARLPLHLGLPLALLLASSGYAYPQAAPAAPAAPTGPKNLLRNGNMEAKPRPLDNLYDGIDNTGKFKAGLVSVKVLGASGALSERRMPSSVSLEDMNRDGKTDVVIALPEGLIYVYFNIGEPNAPAFGNAEILPLFFSRVEREENEFTDSEIWYDRRVPRIGLGEWSKPGAIDIVLGNLFGQLFLIKGTSNTANQVTYTQPRNKEASEIPTTKLEGRYWGNFFSPLIVDWDNDGKKDIIMGEGSYSANSVFLMRNTTGSMPPKFLEENRSFLVTGDGREQLVPALADYNGDGRVDVLVADREGQVSVHLRPENWKLGDTLPQSSFITIAGKSKRGQPITIGTGDYNKDGKFDLIMGESSGLISIAVNTGTAQEPKFDTLENLKGKDVWSNNMNLPPSWELDDASGWGNSLGYAKVVSNEEDASLLAPEGKQALFIGNFTHMNKTVIPGPVPNMAEARIQFRLTQGVSLEQGKKYTIEMQARGAKVTEMDVFMEAWVTGKTPAKADVDDRGAVKDGSRRPEEHWQELAKLTPGPSWRNLTTSFIPKLKDKTMADTNGPGYIKGWGTTLQIRVVLNSPDSVLYLDDIKMYQAP